MRLFCSFATLWFPMHLERWLSGGTGRMGRPVATSTTRAHYAGKGGPAMFITRRLPLRGLRGGHLHRTRGTRIPGRRIRGRCRTRGRYGRGGLLFPADAGRVFPIIGYDAR